VIWASAWESHVRLKIGPRDDDREWRLLRMKKVLILKPLQDLSQFYNS
jgi:hypothetical protein